MFHIYVRALWQTDIHIQIASFQWPMVTKQSTSSSSSSSPCPPCPPPSLPLPIPPYPPLALQPFVNLGILDDFAPQITTYSLPHRAAPNPWARHFVYSLFFLIHPKLPSKVVSLMPQARPGGPGYQFSSGSSPVNCPARGTLPVATLPPVCLSGSLDNRSPSTRPK